MFAAGTGQKKKKKSSVLLHGIIWPYITQPVLQKSRNGLEVSALSTIFT